MPGAPPGRLVIEALTRRFSACKEMAEKAFAQISDEQLHQPLDQNTNSVAVIVKHMSGNLRSRFTDFLTTDGEKPNRDRDSEFIDDLPNRADLQKVWDQAWQILFNVLATLSDADLSKTVKIRTEPHTVIDAFLRQLSHHAYHAGQIVQLSRYLAKDHWTVLTIARGKSTDFNVAMREKHKS